MKTDDWKRPASEEELCERFATIARARGWVVYPETGGFDQLLVGADGTQIGVEAKLRCSYEVLLQAAPDAFRGEELETFAGPDYRGVLVPEAVSCFAGVADHMGLGCYQLRSMEDHDRCRGDRLSLERGRLWPTSKRLNLPDYVPDIPAGVPSPKRMSSWLIAALRLCKILRERGHVTLYDFEAAGLHMGIWTDRWIVRNGDTVPGQRGRRISLWVVKPGASLPDEGCPPRVEAEQAASREGAKP